MVERDRYPFTIKYSRVRIGKAHGFDYAGDGIERGVGGVPSTTLQAVAGFNLLARWAISELLNPKS